MTNKQLFQELMLQYPNNWDELEAMLSELEAKQIKKSKKVK